MNNIYPFKKQKFGIYTSLYNAEEFKKPYQDVMTYVWELKNVCDKGYMWVDAKIKLNDPNGVRVL